MSTTTDTTLLPVLARLAPQKPSIGLATVLGTGVALISAGGAIAAAIANKDTATIAATAGSVVATVTTVGGRMAQAIAMIVRGVHAARPILDAVDDGTRSGAQSGGTVTTDVRG